MFETPSRKTTATTPLCEDPDDYGTYVWYVNMTGKVIAGRVHALAHVLHVTLLCIERSFYV